MRTTPRIFTSVWPGSPRATDLQLAWLDAADDADAAYLAWRGADKPERADAFFVYQAGLDREEAAARALQLQLAGFALRC
jgi:hypothetical protein